MKVELLGTWSPKWIRQIERTRHDFYHLPTYARLSSHTDGGEAAALLVEEGERALLLPIIKRTIPDADGAWDATSPYGYPGPLVVAPRGSNHDANAFAGDALLHAKEKLREAGCVSLFARLHPVLGPVPRLPEDEPCAAVVMHGDTVVVDLQKSESTLWSETASGHRNEINRSIRAGHTPIIDKEFRRADDFLRLYQETMDRVGASSYYYFGNDYLTMLRDALGSKLWLAVVDIGGKTAAAALFIETCGIVEYHLSGSATEFMKERPTKLMLHHMRAWSKARGCTIMHLGGGVGGTDDSLFRFKAGFSRDRALFQTFRMVVDQQRYDALVDGRRSLTGEDGAHRRSGDLTGFFPAYRK